MKEYLVDVTLEVRMRVRHVVEAESKEEAKDIALSTPYDEGWTLDYDIPFLEVVNIEEKE